MNTHTYYTKRHGSAVTPDDNAAAGDHLLSLISLQRADLAPGQVTAGPGRAVAPTLDGADTPLGSAATHGAASQSAPSFDLDRLESIASRVRSYREPDEYDMTYWLATAVLGLVAQVRLLSEGRS